MTFIGQQDWCDEHGPTVVVDDFMAGVPTRHGETTYHVLAYECGCDRSWEVDPHARYQAPEDYWEDREGGY